MNVKKQLHMIFVEMADFIQDVLPHRIFRRALLGLGGIGILAIFGGTIWWYFRSQQDAAYNDLTYLMIDLKSAKESIETDWGLFQEQFLAEQMSRVKAKNTVYLPLLHVDVLIGQGKLDEARVLLSNLLPKLSDSPLLSHVQVFYALLLLDGSVDEQNQALLLLQDIAQKDDYASDYAAYQLGYYHFIHAGFLQAKAVWQPMIDRSIMNEKNRSAWSLRAEEKLNQIP